MTKPKEEAILHMVTTDIGNCDCGNYTDLKWKIGRVIRYICLECVTRDFKVIDPIKRR